MVNICPKVLQNPGTHFNSKASFGPPPHFTSKERGMGFKIKFPVKAALSETLK